MIPNKNGIKAVLLLILLTETFVELPHAGEKPGQSSDAAAPRINIGDLTSQQLFHFQQTFAWAQFTYDYSEHHWCVDAQRRDARPGEFIGGCWKTLSETVVQIEKKTKKKTEGKEDYQAASRY
jgi:hypothetical protein